MSDFLKYPAKNAKKTAGLGDPAVFRGRNIYFFMNVSYWRVSLHRPFFVAGFHYVLMVFFEILFFSLGLKNGRYRVAKPNCLPLSHYICQKKFANLVLHTRFFEFSANCPTYVRISQTFISSIQPKRHQLSPVSYLSSPCSNFSCSIIS